MAEREARAAAVALLWDTRESAGGLREALVGAGAAVVYESSTRSLDRDALERAQAEVIVVNLDAKADDDFDDEVYALLDDPRYRVVFNEGDVSSGLSGWDQARWARHLAAKILGVDVDPPRPSDAEAVPQRAPADAVESLPSESVAVAGDAEVDAVPEESPADVAPTPEPLVAEATVDAATASAVLDLLADPEWSVDLPPPLPETQHVEASLPFVDETIELVEATDGGGSFDELLSFGEPSSDETSSGDRTSEEPVSEEPIAEELMSEGPILEDMMLEDMTLEDPAPAEAEPAGADVETIELQEFTLDESLGFDESFDLSTPEFADEASASADVAPGLDELLAGLDLSEPAEGEAGAPTEASTADIAVPSGDGLELLDLDDESAAPAPAPPPATDAASPSLEELGASLLWSLEAIDGEEQPVPPPTGPAEFGIEKLTAAEFLAPPVEEDGAQAPVEEFGGFDFELIPLEEAVAPVSVETVVSESWLESAPVAAKAKVRRVWVLGASIGGPEAMREFVAEFPRSHPALFVLAQHLGDEFVEMMSRQLAKATPLIVRMPVHGDRVGHGEILIVPNSQRLLVDAEGVVVLERDTTEQPYSPSIDRVIRDMADRFGAAAGAIVFSGMSTDAVEGCRYLVGKGGRVYAQSPESCVVSSMVDGVIEEGLACFVGSPKELAQKVMSET